jgi:hypothetical protein
MAGPSRNSATGTCSPTIMWWEPTPPSIGTGTALTTCTPSSTSVVLFDFLAGFTALEFVTGIVILPQRQTVLVAKQAAQVDL